MDLEPHVMQATLLSASSVKCVPLHTFSCDIGHDMIQNGERCPTGYCIIDDTKSSVMSAPMVWRQNCNCARFFHKVLILIDRIYEINYFIFWIYSHKISCACLTET
jgi:hypothetical protein